MSAIVNHLWQSTLIAGLAWLVTLTLRRERAGVRYDVWLAASLKFLIPFSMFTAFGERFGVRPVVVASLMPYEVMVDTAAAPMADRAVRFSVGQPTGVSLAHRIGAILPDALIALWVLGAAALLIIWLVRWRRVAAVVRASAPLNGGPVHDALRRLDANAGVTRSLTIVESQSSLEPGIFGIISPTLVWPSRIDAHLSAEQIDAILSHEITHVRRRDNLAAAAHMAVQAAFWFHPVVWWLGARLIEERERACDEAVLGAGREPRAYAEGILKTCQLLVESPLACVAGVTGSELEQRIEHIMTNETRPGLNAWKKCLLAMAGSAAVTVPFAVGIMTVAPVQAQQGGRESAAGAESNLQLLELIQVHKLALEERVRIAEVHKRLVAQAAALATPSAGAAFDVTSVKPNNSGSGRVMMLPAANGGWQAENVPLGMLVRLAFQLQDNQLVGGPKWLFEDRFDVKGTGTAPGRDGPLFDKLKSMLKDRFKLVTHVETREQPIYQLVLARRDGKLGEKLTVSTTDCTPTGPNGDGRGRGPVAPPAPGERPKCGFMIGPGRITIGGQTMASFAQTLSRFAGGIVVDKTNLTGTYDVELLYAPDPAISPVGRDLPPQPGAPPPVVNSDAASIFVAIQEQLGLKLEPARGNIDVLVIDSAEKPTPD